MDKILIISSCFDCMYAEYQVGKNKYKCMFCEYLNSKRSPLSQLETNITDYYDNLSIPDFCPLKDAPQL